LWLRLQLELNRRLWWSGRCSPEFLQVDFGSFSLQLLVEHVVGVIPACDQKGIGLPDNPQIALEREEFESFVGRSIQ
jgi:hypothetical protein